MGFPEEVFLWRTHSVQRSCLGSGRGGGAGSREQCSSLELHSRVGTRTVVSRGGEEAAVALTATKIGFSFAASLVLLDIGEGRVGGQQLSFRHPCGHFHKGWGLMWVGGLNRLNLIWG